MSGERTRPCVLEPVRLGRMAFSQSRTSSQMLLRIVLDWPNGLDDAD